MLCDRSAVLCTELLQPSSNISAFLGRYCHEASFSRSVWLRLRLLIDTLAFSNVVDVDHDTPPSMAALPPDESTPTVPPILVSTELVTLDVVAWFVSGSFLKNVAESESSRVFPILSNSERSDKYDQKQNDERISRPVVKSFCLSDLVVTHEPRHNRGLDQHRKHKEHGAEKEIVHVCEV